ncbi:MAG: hypothetical protein GX491_02760 [Chloroflexi bacterium]|nr:hypothetical protein [Chloroflexota bacterium]
MSAELHITVRPGILEPPEDLLDGFPFEPGQSIVAFTSGVIIIDLADADDTTYVQDWFLNSHNDVMSYYVVGD